ncbi:MAG: AmmeMemoRadiSam system protein B [Rudaea sp.]
MTEPSVRPPACADDRWYPSRPDHLRATVDSLLEAVRDEPIPGRLLGLIAPHAGIQFAGPTAAHAYKQLEGRRYSRVIILGPSHFADFGPEAVNASSSFSTPLGEIRVDRAAVARIEQAVDVRSVRQEHEHSLEMQLPFLQRQLGEFTLVPLMMSYPFYLVGPVARTVAERLASALVPLVDDETLLVASSDLSHLDDYRQVQKSDSRLDSLISAFDIDGLIEYMSSGGVCRACGDMAVITLLLTARACGADSVRVLARTNSSEILRQQIPGQYTVGYMAAAVYRSAA